MLHKLPNELLIDILERLDIQSCLNLRQVNRRGRELVTNMTEYRLVTTLATVCFMALIRTGLAQTFTFSDIYRVMLLKNCETCGALARHIYLLTATRACEKCILRHSRFNTVDRQSLAITACSHNVTLRQCMPVLKGIPVNYITGAKGVGPVEQARSLINLKQALSDQSLRSVFAHPMKQRRQFRLMATAPLRHFSADTQLCYRFLSCRGCAWYWEREVAVRRRGSMRGSHCLTISDIVLRQRKLQVWEVPWTRSSSGPVCALDSIRTGRDFLMVVRWCRLCVG